MLWRIFGVVALLLATGLGAHAFAQDCPNERATQVDARVETSEQYETCGVGIKIFGIGGSIIGERCPRWEMVVPAHQICIGESLVDHRCVKHQDLPVLFRNCECGGLIIPFLETGLPVKCSCGKWRRSGHVEDMQTQRCYEVGPDPNAPVGT